VPRFPTRLFLFAFFGWVFDFYDLVLLGFLRDAVGKDLGLSHTAESWMLGVALGASGLGGIISGALADRFGKRRLLAITICLYSLGSLAAGLAPSLPWFLAARAVVGLGVGGEWAIGHGMVAEAVPPAWRGRASAALQSGEPVGVMLAAVAGLLVMPIVGWRWVMIGSSATALLAVAARRSIHLPDAPATERTRIAELASPAVAKRLVCAWILGIFKLGTYWTMYTWLPTFLLRQMHQGVGRSFLWVLTAQVGQLMGMLSFGVVADRLGRRPAFAIYSLTTALGIAPLAFAWGWLSENPVVFWMVMLIIGIGSGCTAGFGALLAELFPSELRATAMGTTYNLARAVQLGAPLLVAFAVERNGLTGGLSVPMLLAVSTSLWVWILPETRGIPLPSLARAAGRASP
jgi:MFS family permease